MKVLKEIRIIAVEITVFVAYLSRGKVRGK